MTAEPLIPARPSIPKLQGAAAGCKACDLWKAATQTVFGEGKQSSTVMFIGEQPGDKEDLSGRPFVGPRARCSTKRSKQRALIGRRSTSRMS